MDDASAYLGSRHRLVGHDLTMMRTVTEIFGEAGRRVFVCHLLQDAGVLQTGRHSGTKGRKDASRTKGTDHVAGRAAAREGGRDPRPARGSLDDGVDRGGAREGGEPLTLFPVSRGRQEGQERP